MICHPGKPAGSVPSQPAQQAQQPVEKGDGMRRASGDIQIHGEEVADPIARFGMPAENAARNRASAGRDDELGFGNRLVGPQGCLPHIRGDRPGNENPVGVAGRGDEVDAKTARVEHHIAESIDFRLAAVAAAGADLAQPQRPPEQPPQLATEGIDLRLVAAGQEKLVAVGCGKPPVAGKRNGIAGTRRGALAAKYAASEVQPRPELRYPYRLGGTELRAFGAAGEAFRGLEYRPAAE